MTDDSMKSEAAEPAPGLGPVRPSPDGLGTDARRRIGRDLRLLYASVLTQPLPERFTRLIDDMAAHGRDTESSR